MATLEGVMRTEFGEGLTLEGAAAEASAEVIVPDRTLAVTRPDGSLVELWGLPVDRSSLPSIVANAEAATVATPGGELRVLTRLVDYNGHRYGAAVMASLSALHAGRRNAVSLGVAMALIAAAVGGWLIGRRTLKPLTRMAEQAGRINERDPGSGSLCPGR